MGCVLRADSCYQGLMCEIYARHGANDVPCAGLHPRWSTIGMSAADNKLPDGLAVPPNVGEAERSRATAVAGFFQIMVPAGWLVDNISGVGR
jgi:hypothetical protein